MPATLTIRVIKDQPLHVRRNQAKCDGCISNHPKLDTSEIPFDATVRVCVIAFQEGHFELCERCRVELSS